ncbi:DsbA family protein [Streptomyces sp. NPDC058685]|uniref:DsbA family protein n=1 Tax=Streptomyces sp. NPDC058685 TaxID=3346598 RepID=UPI00364AF9C2
MTWGRRMSAVAAGVLAAALAGCVPGSGTAAPTKAAEATAYASEARLPEKLAPDGTTITVGDPAARTTVRVYEDPRCPVVEEFELRGGASVLRAKTISRQVKTEYTFASFRDESLGGDGSKRAVNALRAALDAGRFTEYHALLIRNRTSAELSGGFTTGRLLELAAKVPGLRGKEFDHAVTTMKYRSFVTASQAAYDAADGPESFGPGTPTVVINDKRIPEAANGLLFDKSLFDGMLTGIHQYPEKWKPVA